MNFLIINGYNAHLIFGRNDTKHHYMGFNITFKSHKELEYWVAKHACPHFQVFVYKVPRLTVHSVIEKDFAQYNPSPKYRCSRPKELYLEKMLHQLNFNIDAS